MHTAMSEQIWDEVTHNFPEDTRSARERRLEALLWAAQINGPARFNKSVLCPRCRREWIDILESTPWSTVVICGNCEPKALVPYDPDFHVKVEIDYLDSLMAQTESLDLISV
jgi:hypothetical protein